MNKSIYLRNKDTNVFHPVNQTNVDSNNCKTEI